MEKLQCTINEFYKTGRKVIGRVGDNNIGLTKGRFISVIPHKSVDGAVYDEIGVKYVLGTEGETPLGDVIKDKLQALTYETYTGSAVGRAVGIIKGLFGKDCEDPVMEKSTPYKTCTVQIWSWKIEGRKITIKQTSFPTTNRSEMELI